VKACSRPRTPDREAAKAEVVRKSPAARRAGSIPASGTSIHVQYETKALAAFVCIGPVARISHTHRQRWSNNASIHLLSRIKKSLGPLLSEQRHREIFNYRETDLLRSADLATTKEIDDGQQDERADQRCQQAH
jgi:hypothetical protein